MYHNKRNLMKKMAHFLSVCAAYALIISFATESTAEAEIYRYRKNNGTILFTDRPQYSPTLQYLSQSGTQAPGNRTPCRGLTQHELQKRYTLLKGQIQAIADRHGIPRELIKAVITAESCFDPTAISSAGAMGLMQLMPATARDLRVSDPFHPEENLRGGIKYLAMMLGEFAGDVRLALAAYNAGPAAVKRHQGIPPYPETRNYVEKVMHLYNGPSRLTTYRF